MWVRPQRPNIKTLKKTEKHKLLLLQEFDKKGKCCFIKNDGLNGDVTAIWGIGYDEKGREIKTIFAHSNVGFYIYETEYLDNIIKQYTYTVDTLDMNENDSTEVVSDFKYNPYNFIKKINSKSELEKLQDILDVYKQKKYLERTTVLNNKGEPTYEYYFDHKGDTTSYSTYTYSDSITTDDFHYKKNGMTDDFTAYSYLDNNRNVIKSFQIFHSENNKSDTSDFKINIYNSQNKIVSTTAFENSEIFSITTYEYDKGNNLILERYTESDRYSNAKRFTYKYNEKDELTQERIFNESGTKAIPVNTYVTTYEYW
jgi:hypothetical protein